MLWQFYLWILHTHIGKAKHTMYPPTPRQREFERALKQLTEEADGVSPTLRQLAEVLGCSESAAGAIADRFGRQRQAAETAPHEELDAVGTGRVIGIKNRPARVSPGGSKSCVNAKEAPEEG
jgi:hypothetical protein